MTKWLLFAAVLSGAVLGIDLFSSHNQTIGYNRAVGEYSKKYDEVKTKADKLTLELFNHKKDAENEKADREKSLRSDATNARAAADQLRIILANSGSSLPTDSHCPNGDYQSSITVAFAECVSRYTEVAAVADQAESDVAALVKAWPSGTENHD